MKNVKRGRPNSGIQEDRRMERERAEAMNGAAKLSTDKVRPYVDYLLMISGEEPMPESEEGGILYEE